MRVRPTVIVQDLAFFPHGSRLLWPFARRRFRQLMRRCSTIHPQGIAIFILFAIFIYTLGGILHSKSRGPCMDKISVLNLAVSLASLAGVIFLLIQNRKELKSMSTQPGTPTLGILIPQLVQTLTIQTAAIKAQGAALVDLTNGINAEHAAIGGLITQFQSTNPTEAQRQLLQQLSDSISSANESNLSIQNANTSIAGSLTAIEADTKAVTDALPAAVLVATSTQLSLSVASPPVGSDVTLIVLVEEEPAGTVPTGGVAFSDGGTMIGTATLDATGQATLDVPAIAAGDHKFTAAYVGDATNAASASNEVDITVAVAA